MEILLAEFQVAATKRILAEDAFPRPFQSDPADVHSFDNKPLWRNTGIEQAHDYGKGLFT